MTRSRVPLNFKKNTLEHEFWSQNTPVIGIDEVGRGCLAGPVVTAAVMLPIKKAPKFLLDSKIITEKARNAAYAWIMKHCIVGIGVLHNRSIDNINIWQATLLAMKKAALHACQQAQQKPGALLVDAMPLTMHDTWLHDVPVHAYIEGETWSSSIAAASIAAKVTRDRIMTMLDSLFPGYHLAQHKGYSTPLHKKMIIEQNYSIIHRTTFLENTLMIMGKDYEQQQTLW